MRIGLFTDAYLPEISGVTTAVHEFKNELERLGHEAYVYAPLYEGIHNEEAGVFRFRARPFLFYKTSQVALPYNREATRSFKDLDIVHSHTPFSLGAVALVTAMRYHIPHIHTYHTYLAAYLHYLPRPLRPPKKTAEEASAIFCNRCTVVTAPSTSINEELLRYGVHRPIHVLPFGVNLSLFQQEPVWDPRRELGIPKRAHLFLCSGRLAAEKNLRFLLRAFEEIHKTDPGTVFILTGDGPQRGLLQEQVRRGGLNSAVIFTGFIDSAKLIDLYKASDLFLFASKTETQGLVLVEAMAGGTPAVAIGEMGVLDVVRDGVNGILAPEDAKEFGRMALELLNDRGRYERLCQGALRTAEELSTQKSALRFLKLFEECLTPSMATGRK